MYKYRRVHSDHYFSDLHGLGFFLFGGGGGGGRVSSKYVAIA